MVWFSQIVPINELFYAWFHAALNSCNIWISFNASEITYIKWSINAFRMSFLLAFLFLFSFLLKRGNYYKTTHQIAFIFQISHWKWNSLGLDGICLYIHDEEDQLVCRKGDSVMEDHHDLHDHFPVITFFIKQWPNSIASSEYL